MSFAANELKMIYVKRTPETNKAIHVVSSGFKAVLTWHNMHTLQVRTNTLYLLLCEKAPMSHTEVFFSYYF